MRPEDIRKLLGGYATGTLTEAEREALFSAALEDQTLFDELAREHSLHEMLRDPAARAEMLAAVAERPRPWGWWRPAAAAFAMASIATLVVVLPRKKAPLPQAPPAAVAAVKSPVSPAPPPKAEEAPAPVRVLPKAVPQQKARKPFQPPPFPPPAAPPTLDAAAPAPEAPRAAPLPQGVVGGVPGGVIGGIMAAPKPVEVPAAAVNSFAPTAVQMAQAQVAAEAAAAQESARARFYGASAGLRVRAAAIVDAAARQPLGLRYIVLRKQGGEFVEADPNSLGSSDIVALRITANGNGFLSVDGAKPVALTGMEPYTTPPLPPGKSEVRIVFSATPLTEARNPVAVTSETRSGETFIVNAVAAPALGFTIALKRNQ